MDDDGAIIAAAEKREVALAQLREAVAACTDADLTRDEILHVVHPLFTDDDVFVEGPIFDHLEDSEAAEILWMIYGAMPQGATLAFGVRRRSRSKILEICGEADISGENVTINRERDSLRVEITKLQ